MRDLAILSTIVLFWFVYGIMVFAMSQDASLQDLQLQNNSYMLPSNITNIDEQNESSTIPIFTPSYESRSKEGVSMIWKILTFGLASIKGTPTIILLFFSAINWFLTMMALLLIYRLFRSGAG